MSVSLALLIALLLLFPGFGAWAAVRLRGSTGPVLLLPERTNGPTTVFILITGALVAHTAAALALAGMEVGCGRGLPCLGVDFDPNIYRVLATGEPGRAPGPAIAAWMLTLVLLGPATMIATSCLLGLAGIRDRLAPLTSAWARSLVDDIARDDAVIVAYVLSKVAHEGIHVGYEGVVERLVLDENQAIALIVLLRCDRFLFRFGAAGIDRVDSEDETLELLYLKADEIANVAFEVFRPAAAG